jgi:hypothetical protein
MDQSKIHRWKHQGHLQRIKYHYGCLPRNNCRLQLYLRFLFSVNWHAQFLLKLSIVTCKQWAADSKMAHDPLPAPLFLKSSSSHHIRAPSSFATQPRTYSPASRQGVRSGKQRQEWKEPARGGLLSSRQAPSAGQLYQTRLQTALCSTIVTVCKMIFKKTETLS